MYVTTEMVTAWVMALVIALTLLIRGNSKFAIAMNGARDLLTKLTWLNAGLLAFASVPGWQAAAVFAAIAQLVVDARQTKAASKGLKIVRWVFVFLLVLNAALVTVQHTGHEIHPVIISVQETAQAGTEEALAWSSPLTVKEKLDKYEVIQKFEHLVDLIPGWDSWWKNRPKGWALFILRYTDQVTRGILWGLGYTSPLTELDRLQRAAHK